jgi:hypothetical protein
LIGVHSVHTYKPSAALFFCATLGYFVMVSAVLHAQSERKLSAVLARRDAHWPELISLLCELQMKMRTSGWGCGVSLSKAWFGILIVDKGENIYSGSFDVQKNGNSAK